MAPQHQRATTHGFRVVLTIGLRVGNLESHPGIGVRTRTHQDRERGRRDHETSFKGLSKAQESAPSRRTYVLLKRRTRLASPSARRGLRLSRREAPPRRQPQASHGGTCLPPAFRPLPIERSRIVHRPLMTPHTCPRNLVRLKDFSNKLASYGLNPSSNNKKSVFLRGPQVTVPSIGML